MTGSIPKAQILDGRGRRQRRDGPEPDGDLVAGIEEIIKKLPTVVIEVEFPSMRPLSSIPKSVDAMDALVIKSVFLFRQVEALKECAEANSMVKESPLLVAYGLLERRQDHFGRIKI